MAIAVEIEESLSAKFSALMPHLDERQRRLYLGSEARLLGHGGIAVVARASGVDRRTVAAGVDELEAGNAPLGRARRPGGGRKRRSATDPTLTEALLALVEPEVRGDPESPLKWTTKSTRKLAEQLRAAGHEVSAPTVGIPEGAGPVNPARLGGVPVFWSFPACLGCARLRWRGSRLAVGPPRRGLALTPSPGVRSWLGPVDQLAGLGVSI